MGWVNYHRHAEVAIDTSKPYRDRTWALRSCCYSVASTARGTISTNELVTAIAQRAGCQTEVRASDKLVITDRLVSAIELLAKLRAALIVHLHHYDDSRRSAKKSGKRFPVATPFSDRTVWELVGAI